MSGFIQRPPPKPKSTNLIDRPKPKRSVAPELPVIEHPKANVGWKTPYKELTGGKLLKPKLRKPPPLSDKQKLEVLERINKIKNRI